MAGWCSKGIAAMSENLKIEIDNLREYANALNIELTNLKERLNRYFIIKDEINSGERGYLTPLFDIEKELRMLVSVKNIN